MGGERRRAWGRGVFARLIVGSVGVRIQMGRLWKGGRGVFEWCAWPGCVEIEGGSFGLLGFVDGGRSYCSVDELLRHVLSEALVDEVFAASLGWD